MRKISQLRKADAAPAVVLASSLPAMIALLAGKSLFQIGSQLGLNDKDVKFSTWTFNNGKAAQYISLMVDGQKVLVPLSRTFPIDKTDDAEFLLSCEFRQSHLSVKNEDGTPKTDENGALIIDETKPYLSFGKPSGINITEEVDAFAEEAVTAGAGN